MRYVSKTLPITQFNAAAACIFVFNCMLFKKVKIKNAK